MPRIISRWGRQTYSYVPGSSGASNTTSPDSFQRMGVHVNVERRNGEVVRHAAVLVAHDHAHALPSLHLDRRIRRQRVALRDRTPSPSRRARPRASACCSAQAAAPQSIIEQRHRADRLQRYPSSQNAHPTSIPVTYITANPANRPASTGPVRQHSRPPILRASSAARSARRPARWRRRQSPGTAPTRPANTRSRRATHRQSSARRR